MNSLLIRGYVKCFAERNLNGMRAFYQTSPIWNAVRTELGWTHNEQRGQIWQTISAKYLEKRLAFFRAIITVNHYINTKKPAAPLYDMRNPAGLLYLMPIKKLDFFTGMLNISINNTFHASRKICAPWKVTFFYGDKS